MMHRVTGYGSLLILLLVRSASGAGGNLDPTFGSGGKATPAFGEATALAIYADGRLLIGGGLGNFGLARLQPNGDLDPTFAGDGTVSTSGDGERNVSDLVILPDERIIAVGYAQDGFDFSMRLIRYNADGSIDTSYGSGGKVTADFAGGAVSGHAVLQPDGRLLNLATIKYSGGLTYAIALARFSDDGSPDLSFGTGGQVVTDFPVTGEYGNDLILAPSGQFYVVGVITAPVGDGVDNDWLIVRYDADGSIDTTYGSGGRVTETFYGGYAAYESAMGAALQPDGKLVIGGNSGSHIALARYGTDGTLDLSFGHWGKLVVSSLPEVQVEGLVRRADGSLVVGATGYRGAEDVFAPRGFALMAFDAEGRIDTAFAACPQVSTGFGTANATLRTIGMQPDGKVVLVGGLDNGSGAIARYGAPSTPACRPATSGRSTLAVRDNSADTKDLLKWKWTGVAVAADDLGDPTAATGYTFCVLDQSSGGPTLRLGAPLLRTDWSAAGGGFKFRARSDNDFPFTAAKLKAAPSGKGKLKLVGQGEYLHPSLPLTTPAIARLVRDDTETCWEATYSTAVVNHGAQFSARSD